MLTTTINTRTTTVAATTEIRPNTETTITAMATPIALTATTTGTTAATGATATTTRTTIIVTTTHINNENNNNSNDRSNSNHNENNDATATPPTKNYVTSKCVTCRTCAVNFVSVRESVLTAHAFFLLFLRAEGHGSGDVVAQFSRHVQPEVVGQLPEPAGCVLCPTHQGSQQ